MNYRLISSILAIPCLAVLVACGHPAANQGASDAATASGLAKPSLTVNGQDEVTVNVGDELDFAYQASEGTSAQGAAVADTDDSCGISSEEDVIAGNFLSLEGKSSMIVRPCQAGHTYTFTYKVIDESQADLKGSEKSVIVHVKGDASAAAASAPRFTVNGQSEITVQVGDAVHYAFDSGSDTFLSAKISSDSPDECGGLLSEDWLSAQVGRLSGVKTEVIAKCQAGHTYKVELDLQSSSGPQALEVLIHVAAQSAPAPTPSPTPARTPAPVRQPSFSVNGSLNAIVKAGQAMNFSFDAGSGHFANVSITGDSADSCLASLGAKAWESGIQSIQSGAESEVALSCEVGHTYTITYSVTMPDLSEVTITSKVEIEAQ